MHTEDCIPKKAPENSLAAFELAVMAGVGIELDVQLSKDEVPMVFHDKSLWRMCGDKRRISELTCAQLKKMRLGDSKETIPTLSESLELINSRADLLIETKLPKHFPHSHRLEKAIIPLLREYKGKFFIQSFNKYSVRFLKREFPQVSCGILSGKMYSEPSGFDFISYKLKDLDQKKASKLRKKYPKIFAWGNSEYDNLKLDAIIADLV